MSRPAAAPERTTLSSSGRCRIYSLMVVPSPRSLVVFLLFYMKRRRS
jgi:hypothetical protein